MRKVFLVVFAALSITLSMAPLAVTPAVHADAKSEICAGVGVTGGSSNCGNSASTLNRIIATAINILSMLVGLAAVFMIIFGGFRYVTSAGDSSKTSSAKNTIIFAIIGLVFVAVSQFIVQFVLGETT